MRVTRALILCALIAAGCASAGSETPAPTQTTADAGTTSSSTTTSSTSTTSTTVDLPDVSLPDVDIDDAAEAFRSIMGFIDELSRNPQPNLLVGYYDPDCSTYGVVVDSFTTLADNGWRWAVLEPTEITELLPVLQNESDAQLIATYTIAADELYDAEGNLVRVEPEQSFERGITLTRSADTGWRICESLEVIDP